MTKAKAQTTGEGWSMINGDSAEILTEVPPSSVDMAIFSPPYLSIFQYSASERDLGNSTDEQFWVQYRFILGELLRVMKPGRLVAVDVMNVPAMKSKDGYIGLKDFRGDMIRNCVAAGFIWHSEHCMWKDPLIEATRTKTLGLMHKQLVKDSTMSRAGIPQYLLVFRKPGENAQPVAHPQGLTRFIGENPPTTGANMSHERWRRYASPVWDDIDFGRTLNAKAAREHNDERHVCPMSLDITERALELWSNPGDLILSPFAGIGSEGYAALQNGRKFLGIELKTSYYEEACRNLAGAGRQLSILDAIESNSATAGAAQ